MHLKTDGIVLRQYQAQEDRVIKILTRDKGVITAFANGANKSRSKLASSTELLCFSSFVLFYNRDCYTVNSADINHVFVGFRSDIEKLSLACYFAQLTFELVHEGENSNSYLKLLLNALHFLEEDKRPKNQLKALFELRILTLAGYMPQLVACKNCDKFEDAAMWFFPLDGELLCSSCNCPPRLGGYLLSPSVLAAMRHIIYCPPDKLFSFSLSCQSLNELGRISEDYLKHQLEKTLKTLDFYNSIII